MHSYTIMIQQKLVFLRIYGTEKPHRFHLVLVNVHITIVMLIKGHTGYCTFLQIIAVFQLNI